MQPDPMIVMADQLLRVIVVQGIAVGVWLVMATPIVAALVYWHAVLTRQRKG